MTTIAWDGKSVAGDGKAVFSGYTSDLDFEKVRRVGDTVYAGTGFSPLLEALIDWHRGGAQIGSFPSIDDEEVSGSLLVFEGGGCRCYSSIGGGYSERLKPPFSWGSGAHFAIGALKMGANAKRAVEIAAECDKSTGGVIIAIDISFQTQPKLVAAE